MVANELNDYGISHELFTDPTRTIELVKEGNHYEIPKKEALSVERVNEILKSYESGEDLQVASPEEAALYADVIFTTLMERRFGKQSGNYKPYHSFHHPDFVSKGNHYLLNELLSEKTGAPWMILDISKAEWERRQSTDTNSLTPLLRERMCYAFILGKGHDLTQDGYYVEDPRAVFVPDSTSPEGGTYQTVNVKKFIRYRASGPYSPIKYDSQTSRYDVAAYSPLHVKPGEEFGLGLGKPGIENIAPEDIKEGYALGNEGVAAMEAYALIRRFRYKDTGDLVFRDIVGVEGLDYNRVLLDTAATYVDGLLTETDTGQKLFSLVQTSSTESTSFIGRVNAIIDLRGQALIRDSDVSNSWGDAELMEIYPDILSRVKQITDRYEELPDLRDGNYQTFLNKMLSDLSDVELKEMVTRIHSWHYSQQEFMRSQKLQTMEIINNLGNDEAANAKELLNRLFGFDRKRTIFDIHGENYRARADKLRTEDELYTLHAGTPLIALRNELHNLASSIKTIDRFGSTTGIEIE